MVRGQVVHAFGLEGERFNLPVSYDDHESIREDDDGDDETVTK